MISTAYHTISSANPDIRKIKLQVGYREFGGVLAMLAEEVKQLPLHFVSCRGCLLGPAVRDKKQTQDQAPQRRLAHAVPGLSGTLAISPLRFDSSRCPCLCQYR
eukprot:794381-Rhodomonas_salina.1